MKRAISLLAVMAALCLPVVAGETNGPPLPPPCTENCTQTTTTEPSPIPAWLLLLITGLIQKV